MFELSLLTRFRRPRTQDRTPEEGDRTPDGRQEHAPDAAAVADHPAPDTAVADHPVPETAAAEGAAGDAGAGEGVAGGKGKRAKHPVVARVITTLAALVVLLALNAPNRISV